MEEAGSVVELFEEQAGEQPEAVAVEGGGERDEVWGVEPASQPGGQISEEEGSGSGGASGVCVERSVEMVVGLLGILKSGRSVCAAGSEVSGGALEYMMEDAEVGMVLSEEEAGGEAGSGRMAEGGGAGERSERR